MFRTYNGPFGEKDVSTPPTAKIPACGGFITAVNSVIPNMPKFDTLNKNSHSKLEVKSLPNSYFVGKRSNEKSI